MGKLVGWKEKLTNKENDKQFVAHCLLHSTTCHTQSLNQISKPPGKSLTEESLQTNRYTKIQQKVDKAHKSPGGSISMFKNWRVRKMKNQKDK